MTKIPIPQQKIKYKDYEATLITPNVYEINEFNLATSYLIIGQKYALCIDCLVGVKDYMSYLRTLTSLPILLTATHGHFDHIGGRGQFDNLHIHPKDLPFIKKTSPVTKLGYILLNRFWGIKVGKIKNFNLRNRFPEPPVTLIEDGYTFDLGAKTVTAIHTPGHTLGSTSYILNEDNILFTGDVVSPVNFMFLKGASDVDTLYSSLTKLADCALGKQVYYSHYHNNMPLSILLQGKDCAYELSRRDNSVFPFIKSFTHKDYTVIYRANKIHSAY